MEILKTQISKSTLKTAYSTHFETMIKCVVDIEKGILAVDAEMHADLEQLLLEDGSSQENLWGFNLYPDKEGEAFIEYTSFINIRPRQKNKSMEVADPKIRKKIMEIVKRYVK